KNLRSVVIAELGNKDAYGIGLLFAERARIEAGPVAEFCCRLDDTVACLLGNGSDPGRVVQDQRDCRGRKIEVLPQGAQADRLSRLWFSSLLRSFNHYFLLYHRRLTVH